jgi:hypothetical protein
MAFSNWRAILELIMNATRLSDLKSAGRFLAGGFAKRLMPIATPCAHRGPRLRRVRDHLTATKVMPVFQGERIPPINPQRGPSS